MLLAVDIGNTNTVFGFFKADRLIKKVKLSTHEFNCEKELIKKIKDFFKGADIDAAIICSVVPKAEKMLTKALKKLIKIKPLVLGKDIKVPIRNLYKRPGQVGQDRLVNAYAGSIFYKTPLIIVDFGTAITFDVVSKDGAYLGGIITPGVDMTLDALSEKTALLPKIKLIKISPIVGKTTPGSISSGIFYGFSSMCDGLVARLEKRFGLKFNVIATGGDARLIAKLSATIGKIDENLILKGIELIYRGLKKCKIS